MNPLPSKVQPLGTTAMRRQPLSRVALRGLAAGLLAGIVGALAFGDVAGAQAIAGFNSNQPVNYAADRIELQDRQNRVVLAGGVVINQGDLTLTAERTTVAYTDDGPLRIQRIVATGGVVVSRGNERASGAVAVYDFNRRVIVLSGGVSLRRGSDTLKGGRLTVDLNTGLSSVDGRGPSVPGAVQGSDGRVSGTFSVPNEG